MTLNLDGLVDFMIGGLQLGVGLVGRIGLVMKAAVGEWATEALVKEEEQQGDHGPAQNQAWIRKTMGAGEGFAVVR